MKHSLETLSAGAPEADRTPRPLGADIESGSGAKGAAGERGTDAASGTVSKNGRVLLLEDDASFRHIITDCLTENGYEVVAVHNGGEAVREVLASDFALVLCDLMMPCLSGDMFFRVVERISPALCQRFVFMTGHQCDAGTDALIQSVKAFVLRKPFPLKNLLDAIAFVECRLMHRSVFDSHGMDVNPLPGSDSLSFFQTGSPAVAEKAVLERILARSRTNPPLAGPSDPRCQGESQPCASGIPGALLFATVTLMLALAGGLWIGNLIARDRLETAALKRQALEEEWAAVSPDLQEALARRSEAAGAEKQLAWLSAHRAKPRWAWVLRCIVPAGDAMVEILGVEARADAKDTSACEVSVVGIAGGAEPRQMANHFRESLEQNLKRDANGRAVSTRFERLDDAPALLPEQKRADFVITVSVAPGRPALAMQKGGL